MKWLGFYLMNLALLCMLAACGKNNESGKRGSSFYSNNPYGYGNPYTSGTFGPIMNTGFAHGSVSVDQVISQTPCLTSNVPHQNRMRVQFPLTGFPSVVPAGDLYVGVTTAGDVSLLVGQGNNAPLFVAFMCQRTYAANGTGQLLDIATGTTSRCNFNPLVRATMVVPGLQQPLYFRYLDGGRLNPQTNQLMPYTPPVCL
jgi:hypothetical protein